MTEPPDVSRAIALINELQLELARVRLQLEHPKPPEPVPGWDWIEEELAKHG